MWRWRWSSVTFVIYCFLNVFSSINALLKAYPMFADLANDTDLSEIYGIIERNEDLYIVSTLTGTSVTFFAPMNMGFQISGTRYNYKIPLDDVLLSYHIILQPYRREELPSPIVTSANGNAPLFITKTKNGDVYVNNAKILRNRSKTYDRMPKKKIVHIIDEVIRPLRVKPEVDDTSLYNPSAWGLLSRSYDFELGDHTLNIFSNRVRSLKKEEWFRNSSLTSVNTYFIPVDAGMRNVRLDAIDEKIMGAHVIFGEALFLNPTPEHKMYETAAFEQSVKVVVLFAPEVQNNVTGGTTTRHRFVKSSMRGMNHPNYTSGVVMSEIVYPNIPVQNGVVHLIQKPLMYIDKTILQLLEENSLDPIISTFKEKLHQAGSSVLRTRLGSTQAQPITLFIPTNSAWKDKNVEKVLGNDTAQLQNILDLHMVQGKLLINTINERNSKDYQSLSKDKKFLFFNVIIRDWNMTLTVEGGGVNATVLHPDIGATNGVIHIIDRVLGIPYATVGRKVATDPEMNYTHNLGNIARDTTGKYRDFNDKLDDPSKNFTFFVPRDAAWELFRIQQPKLYEALSKPGVAYEVLNRHLIEDRNFTMSDLKKTSNRTFNLQTNYGGLNIQVVDEPKDAKSGYTIKWYGEDVSVHSADVQCTNGIIHIIDKVLIRPNELKLPVGSALKNVISFPTLLLFVLPLGMMGFYH